MPATSYFNPGSQETARLAFEEQQGEETGSPLQSEAIPKGNDYFQGQQDLANLRETSGVFNGIGKEAEEVQNRFMEQSAVQQSSMGQTDDAVQNSYPSATYTRTYQGSKAMDDVSKPSIGNEVSQVLQSFGVPSSYPQAAAPVSTEHFEMPAGYSEDGSKKSIVTKQILPLSEPHPGRNFLFILFLFL